MSVRCRSMAGVFNLVEGFVHIGRRDQPTSIVAACMQAIIYISVNIFVHVNVTQSITTRWCQRPAQSFISLFSSAINKGRRHLEYFLYS